MRKKKGRVLDTSAIKFKRGGLAREVESLSCEHLFGCYQCGTCSAGCPYVDDMDLTPDEVIRYVILDRDDVLQSKTIWLCSSCFVCAERCPRDINITRIMEALCQIILRKNIDYSQLKKIPVKERKSIPQLAFVSLFRKNIG